MTDSAYKSNVRWHAACNRVHQARSGRLLIVRLGSQTVPARDQESCAPSPPPPPGLWRAGQPSPPREGELPLQSSGGGSSGENCFGMKLRRGDIAFMDGFT